MCYVVGVQPFGGNMHDIRNEREQAWRLWNLLAELESFLWERYEEDFIQRHLAEEDRRWSIKSDAFEEDPLPF
jgi:hypothetical protein